MKQFKHKEIFEEIKSEFLNANSSIYYHIFFKPQPSHNSRMRMKDKEGNVSSSSFVNQVVKIDECTVRKTWEI